MTDSPNPIDPERLAAVERAREGWIRRLIDTSRRNNLLYFRDLKVGTLDLSCHSSDGMAELLVGEVITLSRLLPDSDPVKLAAQAKEIVRRAVSNLEEKGLDTLFLAFGMATWNPDDDGRPPDSAVLLLPVKVTTGGRGSRSISLERNGDPQLNLALLHVLETDFGCCLSPEEVLTAPDGEEMNLTEIYALVSVAAKDIDGFQIKPRVVLGNFSFQKMAMLKDLKDHGPELASHDMIAALAGDPTARDSVFSSRTNIDPSESDLVPPENEFLFLDADSSQQRVIASALKGHDGVIQGPPGGGKSQTIANLIVSFAAQGKRILFVAEKRAALEVVMRRLNVAVTRARRRMTLVSSFGHLDMDPSRSKARGVELLRLYLQYASGHGLALESSGRTDIPLNPFEADVFDTLISKGIPLVPQWGESRYRIDMVAQHPKQPGRFVLAIECDGASYHSAPTARDRDRLRQQQLEALGWRFHRIWSTDWFFKREQEINRTLVAYQMAVERVDRLDSVDCLQSPPMTSDAEIVTNISDGPSINYSLSLRQDPRPKIPKYGDIGEYKTSQLISIIRWIESDGLLRTDDEMSSEVFRELGFQRRGPRIMEQIQKAIRRSHHSRS